MNHLYIAEDGTIHNRGSPPASTRNTSFHDVGTGRKVLYWLFCLACAFFIGRGLSPVCGMIDLGGDELGDLFEGLLPGGVIFGALLGAILYGCNGAHSLSYNLGACIVSALCAVVGAVAVGLFLCVIPLILMGFWYIFLIGLVIGVIAAFFSGGG